MMAVHHFTADKPEREPFAPPAERVLHGRPVGDVRNGYESPDGTKLCGQWSCAAGAWRVSYAEWEFCYILEGHVRLTNDDGSIVEAQAGSHLVIEPGFSGIWENLTPVRKIYVIDLGPAPSASGEQP
jgi:uncharacterized cupin superfamily protein